MEFLGYLKSILITRFWLIAPRKNRGNQAVPSGYEQHNREFLQGRLSFWIRTWKNRDDPRPTHPGVCQSRSHWKHIEKILIGSEMLTPALKSALARDQQPRTSGILSFSAHRPQRHPFPAHLHTIPVISRDRTYWIDGILILSMISVENEQSGSNPTTRTARYFGEWHPFLTWSSQSESIISVLAPAFIHELGAKIQIGKLHRVITDCTVSPGLMESIPLISRPMEKRSPNLLDLGILRREYLDRCARLNARSSNLFQSLVLVPRYPAIHAPWSRSY